VRNDRAFARRTRANGGVKLTSALQRFLVALLLLGVGDGAALAGHRAAHEAPDRSAKVEPDDLSGAIPAHELGTLPTTADQYRALKGEIAKTRPGVEEAKRKSDALKHEADVLRRRLIDTAARVQALEEDKGRIDSEIVNLAAEQRSLAVSFSQDRIRVSRLLAVLERLQRDMPPILVMKPDDALGAARGAMLLGATLPRVYGAAADLARQLGVLRKTHAELVTRRAESVRNAVALAGARTELDQLLAMKSQEADEASARYGDLAAKLGAAVDAATDLGALLDKVAALRAQPATRGVVVVAARNVSFDLTRGSLKRPVVGRMVAGDAENPGDHLPGISFLTQAAARVVAPADSQVLFAGPYHKTGQVLILQSTGGYDLVLAGLERIDVRSGDQLLAGEPLGTMPRSGTGARLYFELRQNGRGVDPAPWLQVELRKAKKT
jgi:septal ring factor EnvC (AmiA/AmiB activator)